MNRFPCRVARKLKVIRQIPNSTEIWLSSKHLFFYFYPDYSVAAQGRKLAHEKKNNLLLL
jgi:hypothetical protein